jgi:hypothetical protein
MIDSARTVARTSATMGWAAWNWIRDRLAVWDAGAELLPDSGGDLCFSFGTRVTAGGDRV